MQVDPIIGQEFVATAKAIIGKQANLMKQIIGLGFLFDMSIASLSKALSDMAQTGMGETERAKAVKKSIEGVERAIEKL